MASLRNIMNVDDEHTNSQPTRDTREPVTRPPQHSVPAPSAYAAAPELSMHQPSASSHSRGASPYSAYSHTPDSTSSHRQAPLSMSPERRRSIHSDHMDYPYPSGQPYDHSSTYANPPMRSLMPGDPAGEGAVKLTPITGRVSRAKKGVPVHTCDICRPPKTFTRAEHLRRHQLSHQPAKLVCSVPGCNKVFHRKDLLERHQQRHEHEDKPPTDGRQPPNMTQGRGVQPYGGMSQAPMTQYGHFGNAGASSNQPRHDDTMQSRWPPNGRPSAPSGHPISTRTTESSRDYYAQGLQREYAMDTRPNSQRSPSYNQPSTAASANDADPQQDLHSVETGQSPNKWHDSPIEPSSSTGSAYSTPSDISHDSFARGRSSSGDWHRMPSHPTTTVSDINASLPLSRSSISMFGYSSSVSPPVRPFAKPASRTPLPLPGYEDDAPIRDQDLASDPSRSLPLPFTLGNSSETLVTVPAAVPSRHMHTTSFAAATRTEMDTFVTPPLPSTTLTEGARGAIPVYLEVYWNKVHPMYPVIHKPTFEAATKTSNENVEILQCAMAAIATQFLGHEDHRINGNQLHLHSMHKLKMISFDDHWPLETMQAVLLSEYYSRFRGRGKDAYQASPLFAFLYQKVAACEIDPGTRDDAFVCPNESWNQWVECETRRRLLSACFLLDVHCMRYFEQAPVSAVGLDYSTPHSLPIPLTSSSDQPWESPSPAAWSKVYEPQNACMTVQQAISQGLKPADIQQTSPFDASVLLVAYTLQFKPRQSPTRVDLVPNASAVEFNNIHVANLFARSAVANTYLALHHTPLHVVLSVSGDSWVFNKKVLRKASFIQYQSQLARWRESGSAAVASAFAARALETFLGFDTHTQGTNDTTTPTSPNTPACADISDYWGIYVCSLICWAFGHGFKDSPQQPRISRPSAVQWLVSAAKLQPSCVQRLAGRENAQGVVSLAREALEKDHFGDRSILIADAVGVLRKLEAGDAWRRF